MDATTHANIVEIDLKYMHFTTKKKSLIIDALFYIRLLIID